MRSDRVLTIMLLIVLFDYSLCGHSFYLKSRIKRNNNNQPKSNIDEMGKFFLKASKSVPRIGRRNDEEMYSPNTNFNKKSTQIPVWTNLPDQFEYEPELFTSPDLLLYLDEALDDSNEWNKLRVARTPPKFI